MRWTCEKCGKKMDVSEEQLFETQGVIVCPQCLATVTVPGYKRAKKKTEPKNNFAQATVQKQVQSEDSTRPKHIDEAKKKKATPPPYHKKTSFVEKPVTTTPRRTTPAAPINRDVQTTVKKKKKKKKKNTPTSGWGCLWQSILFTIILLVIYLAVGYLLQGV